MNPGSSARTSLRHSAPSIRQITLVVAVLIVGASVFAALSFNRAAPAVAQDDATPAVQPAASPVADADAPACATLNPDVGFEAWVRSELYFGAVSDDEWQEFLDEEVTPRFPDGLTVLDGYGQFRGSDGVISEEDSTVLIIFYPLDGATESSDKLEEIRELYKAQFDMESVLRVDDLPVCVSF